MNLIHRDSTSNGRVRCVQFTSASVDALRTWIAMICVVVLLAQVQVLPAQTIGEPIRPAGQGDVVADQTSVPEGPKQQETGRNQAAERGYRFLIGQPVLPGDFTAQVFDQLWTVWPEPLRSKAEQAGAKERRMMILDRYGLTVRPNDDSLNPLQYVVDQRGAFTMNCFACHGGSVYGKVMPGAPNNRYALQSLTEDIGKVKLRLGILPGTMELGAIFIPLGTNNGTTNAVVFGMALLNGRDADLNVIPKLPGKFIHHDMDAPPWWHFSKKPQIYIDGFAAKGHRALMQFALVPENGPDFFHRHEDDFRDVFAYISSIEPPKYDGPIDQPLADRGRKVFNQSCADCHGTYGQNADYPNLRVPIDQVGTDPVRLKALTPEGRQRYADSWFARSSAKDDAAKDGPAGNETARETKLETVIDPGGYVAPPLDGVWASAPYFHNGSVPTLWHVMHPEQRPVVWRPLDQTMDQQKVGLNVETLVQVPAAIQDPLLRRSYFDTRKPGKSRQGHDFPNQLNEDEKAAVLEYLKTL